MKFREDLVLRHVGKDHVIVDPGQDMVDLSKVYTLNDSAAWLWEQLKDKEFTKDTMLSLLEEAYEVTRAQAEEDVQNLVDMFEKHALLKN
jgi:hypothetical protein